MEYKTRYILKQTRIHTFSILNKIIVARDFVFIDYN